MTERSDHAQRLLDDPLLQEAFASVRQYWLERVEMLPLDAETGKDALYDIRKMLLLLRQVEDTLNGYVQDGHLEDFRAGEQERPGFLGDLTKWKRKRA